MVQHIEAIISDRGKIDYDRILRKNYLPIQAISIEALREKSVCIHDSAAKLDHTKGEIIAVQFFEIQAEAIKEANYQ